MSYRTSPSYFKWLGRPSHYTVSMPYMVDFWVRKHEGKWQYHPWERAYPPEVQWTGRYRKMLKRRRRSGQLQCQLDYWTREAANARAEASALRMQLTTLETRILFAEKQAQACRKLEAEYANES